MSARVVLFGATGYSGELTARAMAKRGMRPVLAGRSDERLRALAAELGGGYETRVADVSQPQTVRALVGPGDVLVTTVGPFARWGEPALEAAIGAGAHYVDSTGEPSFIRRVFESDDRARQAGSALLTASAYDWVPGNLAGALALREAGSRAVGVRIGYFVTGGGLGGQSGGTRASSAGALLEPGFAWRGGRLVTERGAKRVHTFDVGGRKRQGISIGTSEHFSLPQVHQGLRDVDVYLGWFGKQSRGMQIGGGVVSAITAVPGVRGVLRGLAERAVKTSTGGPDEAARADSGSLFVAEALDADGQVAARVELQGVNAYTFTGELLAWAAQRIAEGGLEDIGALGPVEAFGLDALEAGVAECGIARA